MWKNALLVSLIVSLFCGVAYAETLHLVTEDYPPFNMPAVGKSGDKVDTTGTLTGISVDIVKELFKRAGIDYTLEIYPWQRAYDMGLNQPGYGVFSTTRTKEREALFKWVGPLVENDWVFFVKKNSGIKIQSLDDARKYRIGGYQGDAVALYLEKENFKLDLVTYDHMNAKKLDMNRIDIWATGKLLGPYFAKQERTSGVKGVYTFKKTVMSLAFNKSVPDAVIAKLNKILKGMNTDGTVQEIYKRYR